MGMVAMEDMEAMVIMVMARDQQLLAMDMEVMEAMADMVMAATVDMEVMVIMVTANVQQLLAMATDIMVGMEDTEVTAMEVMVMAMAMANEPMSPFDAATMLQKLDKKVNLQIMCDECFRRNSSTKFAWSDLIHSESLFSHFPKILRLCFILASVERVTYDLQIQRHK